jgi:hypothetical protein
VELLSILYRDFHNFISTNHTNEFPFKQIQQNLLIGVFFKRSGIVTRILLRPLSTPLNNRKWILLLSHRALIFIAKSAAQKQHSVIMSRIITAATLIIALKYKYLTLHLHSTVIQASNKDIQTVGIPWLASRFMELSSRLHLGPCVKQQPTVRTQGENPC